MGKGEKKHVHERQRVEHGHVWWRRRVAEDERRVRGRKVRGSGRIQTRNRERIVNGTGWDRNVMRNGVRKVEGMEWEGESDRLCAGQSGIPAQTGGLHIISPPLKSGPSPVQARLCGGRCGGVGWCAVPPTEI